MSDHQAWEYDKDYHSGDSYGCIWRHDGDGYKFTDKICDHKNNAFKASKARKDMFKDVDHEGRSKDLGYVDATGALSNKGTLAIETYGSSKDKDEKWVKTFFNRYKTSMYWLSIDKDAWTIDHQIKDVDISHADSSKTFLPRPQGGPGAWFPYHHNAHHIIPQGAFKNFVILADGETSPAQRMKVVLASKWNINDEVNMVILPQELQVAEIAKLPAHCPYFTRSHADYSNSLEKELENVRGQVDKAIKTDSCEDIDEISLELEEVSKLMLDKIKLMDPGKQVGK
ncbi:hypothetical protein A9Q99_22055 [Gammaproteobacteria bacterium 45_16_T64]|nr:hypothetical protein A9Q99_22055 [Gammaproteobacteria bacterium 45_16_T64]